MNKRVTFGFEITKFDTQQRIVEGIATDAIQDRQGDIIPFAVAVEAFQTCADSLGIREMHQPKAVGRLEGWQADSDAQSIPVQVYISESTDGQDTLTKVEEKILRGFSIGGNALASHREGGANIIDKLEIVEISLVDVPANPHAVISVVKAVGMEAKHRAVTKGLAGSFQDKQQALQAAVEARCPGDDTCCGGPWVDDWSVNEVVYSDAEGHYWQCAWGTATDGSVYLGTPTEVESMYVPVSGTEAITTSQEVPSMSSELVIKNREDMAVAKALTARNLVQKGDVGSAINSVSELLSTAGSDPDALAQAQAALSVVGEMVSSMGSSSSSDSSSTDSSSPSSTSSTSSSSPSSSSSTDSSSPSSSSSTSSSSPSSESSSTFSASSPSTMEKEACKEASSTSTPSTSTTTDPSTTSVKKDAAPAGIGVPAGMQAAPGGPDTNVMVVGVSLQEAARAGAQAVLDQLLAEPQPLAKSKEIGVTLPNTVTSDPIVKAVESGDMKSAVETAGSALQAEEAVMKSVTAGMGAAIAAQLRR